MYRAKQRQERKKEQAEKKAEIERYRRYWKELKDLSMNGKCTWRYVTATSTSRSFTTVIDEKTVTLDISIDEKTKQPSYRISSPNIRKSLSLGRKEGDAFERFLLSHCTHSAYIKSNVECLTKTADEYYVFKSACSELVIDASGGVANDGTNINLWRRNGSDAQKWKLKRR